MQFSTSEGYDDSSEGSDLFQLIRHADRSARCDPRHWHRIQKNGQMIEKVLQVEKPGAIPELRQGSAAVILFMVHLHEDGKSTIALKDLAGKTPYLENKEIQNVVDLVIKQFQE